MYNVYDMYTYICIHTYRYIICTHTVPLKVKGRILKLEKSEMNYPILFPAGTFELMIFPFCRWDMYPFPWRVVTNFSEIFVTVSSFDFHPKKHWFVVSDTHLICWGKRKESIIFDPITLEVYPEV